MMKIVFNIFLFLIAILFFWNNCLASDFYFSPKAKEVSEGEKFDINVILNPAGEKVYTLGAKITYPPSLLKVESFSFGDDFVVIDQENYDLVDNTNGLLIKTGGVPSGIGTTTFFGSISFTAKKEGTANIEASKDSFIYDRNNSNVFFQATAEKSAIIIKKSVDPLIYFSTEARLILEGKVDAIIADIGLVRDSKKEISSMSKYLPILTRGLVLKEGQQNSIIYFVTYGTKNTLKLGEGERAGVINSYKQAFGKLPATEGEWLDLIKIANGRWPNERNVNTEKTAESTFAKIYLRKPDRKNPHDDAAVVIMAYGMRLANRNLNSEKASILIYKAIFKRSPQAADEWDATRAIAYSGAVR